MKGSLGFFLEKELVRVREKKARRCKVRLLLTMTNMVGWMLMS